MLSCTRNWCNAVLSILLWQTINNSGLVHTMPAKFENATLRAKTEQMFCVHIWKRNKCSASTLERFWWFQPQPSVKYVNYFRFVCKINFLIYRQSFDLFLTSTFSVRKAFWWNRVRVYSVHNIHAVAMRVCCRHNAYRYAGLIFQKLSITI